MRPVTLLTDDASVTPQVSEIFPPDIYLNPFSLSIQATVTGTATYTVEWTQADIWAADFDPEAAIVDWQVVGGMDGATVDATATFNQPVRGMRVRQTAGDGSVSVRFVQGGAVS